MSDHLILEYAQEKGTSGMVFMPNVQTFGSVSPGFQLRVVLQCFAALVSQHLVFQRCYGSRHWGNSLLSYVSLVISLPDFTNLVLGRISQRLCPVGVEVDADLAGGDQRTETLHSIGMCQQHIVGGCPWLHSRIPFAAHAPIGTPAFTAPQT